MQGGHPYTGNPPRLSFQHRQDDLGAVAETDGDAAVAQTSADIQKSLAPVSGYGVESPIVLGKKALPGAVDAAHEGKTKLPTVDVPRKDQISPRLGVIGGIFGVVRQQDGEAITAQGGEVGGLGGEAGGSLCRPGSQYRRFAPESRIRRGGRSRPGRSARPPARRRSQRGCVPRGCP